MAVPGVALVLFLVYSAVHFGSDRYQQGGIIHAAARGAIPILLPIAFHAEEVSKLFSTIASTDINIAQYRIAAWALAAVAVLFTVAVAFRREKYVSAAEAALLVALNFTCPPLIAFTVYFVFLHSIRHIIELAGWLEPDSLARGFYRIMRQSLVVTGLLLAAGAAASFLISADDVEPAIIRAVFVGLSCLTVPHMVVTHLAEKRIGRA